ncbi:potassium channel subfamily K member 13a isoform X2 [Oncorhynchus mykiss]|uniref:Tyrosyl-DNA phosphodiesterase 1 n=1 Tax=Oncorhynchus mykiss TaxID=8022 RepID=A0A8C7RLT9_ONCMY|nr:potassium channel subfamily K member 13a isoform X2 [Oncorhynchus mykiss]
MACRRGCCCGVVNEDNARFLTLAVLIVLYLLCGAAVFSALEQPKELQANEQWAQRFERFTQKHSLNRTDLETFLRFYEEANIAGIRVDTLRPRWDFTGAFYFVGTVVSTIGFGMTTPTTVSGKVFLIFYGLIGCASTILFFNLFLERIITVLAFVLKSCHDLKRRRQGVMPHDGPRGAPPPGPRDRGRDSLAGWKPSVYYVMLILCVAAVVISCCASAMYSAVEGWGYLDSLYFCFVAFSTIGFGDMVSSQRVTYEGNQTAYRLGNFLFILMGVCCIYSLFNVISIVIKQTLNWLLRKLDIFSYRGCCHCCPAGIAKRLPPRRNAVMPSGTGHGHSPAQRTVSIETDALNESETDGGRRMSGEMISIRDFLAANKVNLDLMQKQLSEAATNGIPRPSVSNQNRQNGFSGGVGALGIMNNRLAETSVDR